MNLIEKLKENQKIYKDYSDSQSSHYVELQLMELDQELRNSLPKLLEALEIAKESFQALCSDYFDFDVATHKKYACKPNVQIAREALDKINNLLKIEGGHE